MSKLEKSGKFRTFRPWNMTFRAIQSNPPLGSWLVPSLEGSCQNREKVTDQFLRKCSKICYNFDLLERTFIAIQPNPSNDMLLMSS